MTAERWAFFLVGLGFMAFFSGAETGILFADRQALRRRLRHDDRRGPLIERFLERPHWFWTTAMSGSRLCLAFLFAPACAWFFCRDLSALSAAAGAGFGLAVVFVGRVLPRLYFLPRANQTIVGMAQALGWFNYLFAPLMLLLIGIDKVTHALLGRGRERNVWLTRDELKLMLTTPGRRFLDEEGRQMIDRIFEFSETLVEDAMIPLVGMDALEDTVTAAEAWRKIGQNMYSRYPVYHERIDNVVGKVLTVELLQAGNSDAPIAPLVRPVAYVPWNKPVDELLFAMQREDFSLAVVVDEYGGCVGIITREDIVEEIVGEIEDEHDEPSEPWRKIDDHRWEANAAEPLDELSEALELELPEGDYDTLAGFLLFLFRRVPRAGEKIRYRELVFTVLEATPRALLTVRIERKPPSRPG